VGLTDDDLLAGVDTAPWSTGKHPGHQEMQKEHDPELWQAIVHSIARLGLIGYLNGEAYRFLVLGEYRYWRQAELRTFHTLKRSRHSAQEGEISWADDRTGEKCVRVSSRKLADEELTATRSSTAQSTSLLC
jgi:hypothetical protein